MLSFATVWNHSQHLLNTFQTRIGSTEQDFKTSLRLPIVSHYGARTFFFQNLGLSGLCLVSVLWLLWLGLVLVCLEFFGSGLSKSSWLCFFLRFLPGVAACCWRNLERLLASLLPVSCQFPIQTHISLILSLSFTVKVMLVFHSMSLSCNNTTSLF